MFLNFRRHVKMGRQPTLYQLKIIYNKIWNLGDSYPWKNWVVFSISWRTKRLILIDAK